MPKEQPTLRSMPALLLLASLCVLLCMPYLTCISTSHTTVGPSVDADTELRLPVARPANPGDLLTVHGAINVPLLALPQLVVVPDDCLTFLQLGDKALPLTEYGGAVCDWSKGVTADLNPLIQSQDTAGSFWQRQIPFTASVQNLGGSMGLRVRSPRIPTLFSPSFLAPLIVALLSLAALFYQRGYSLGITLVVVAGILLRWGYLACTDFQERAHDVDAHLSYIQHISNEGSLPSIASGWAYFQAPLYYIILAVLHRIGGEGEPSLLAMQLFSLLCSVLFLVAGVSLFNRLFPQGRTAALLSALLAFWPALIIHSTRISNDLLLHCIYAIGLVFLFRWWDERSPRDLAATSILAGAAVLTKANGLTLFVSMLAVFLLKELRDRPLTSWKARLLLLRQASLLAVPCAAAAVVTFGRGILSHLNDPKIDWLVGQAFNWMNVRLLVNNTPFEYFYFDIRTFLKEPFLNPWLDESGRQFFWNYLLKSSLFGEFNFSFVGAHGFALVLAAGLLILLSFVAIFVGSLNRRGFYQHLPYLVAVAVQLGFLLLFRIKTPVSGNADFRYIAPALLPMLALFGLALQHARNHDRFVLSRAGALAALLFAGCSGAFFLLLVAQS